MGNLINREEIPVRDSVLDLLLIFCFFFFLLFRNEETLCKERRKCFSEIMFSSFSRAVKVENVENTTAIIFFKVFKLLIF